MPKVKKQTTKRKKKQGSLRSAWDMADGVKINLYGRSGTGKTTLWATFPKPILAIVCSGGKRPGELKSIDTPKYRKTIEPLVIKESLDVFKLLERMGDFKTLVLDHATGLQDMVLKELLGLDELPAQRSWGLASQQQWGQCALQMKGILRAILSIEQNVVIVAQEREFNTDSDGDLLMPYVASALTPSVTGWLNPACDYICQTFIRPKMVSKTVKVGGKSVTTKKPGKGVQYCIRTAPDAVYTTKFRLPKGASLPDVIVDPDYKKINALIRQT